MQFDGKPELGHLTYCTNIHAGESWPEVLAGLEKNLPLIKSEIAPDRPFGVGLRLGASASEALTAPAAFEKLRGLLDDGDYYVFTINGFPYGAFHGERVKENAYRPDWTEPERLRYTNRLADQLAELLPDGMEGSVSTVPLTFKPWADGALDSITENLIAHVAHLFSIEQRTGKTIVLALEPEPCCLLETIEEVVAYFEQHLFSNAGVKRLVAQTGLSDTQAADALRRYIGVCYDVCHAAVEFEDPRASIASLQNAGIEIAKVQLSSALRIAEIDKSTADHLRHFDEGVYLHQVVESGRNGMVRYIDMPDALERVDDAAGAEWRVHFHVPVFLDELQDFGTTQSFLREILSLHREKPITRQLEVETYTWDVLPERYRKSEVSAAIARELAWVKAELTK